MPNYTRQAARVKPAKHSKTSTNQASNRSREDHGCTGASYERLLAIMQSVVDKDAARGIDWDAEWGDQREED